MEEVYNLHQHTYCAVIQFKDDDIYIGYYINSKRNEPEKLGEFKYVAHISYDQQETGAFSWIDRMLFSNSYFDLNPSKRLLSWGEIIVDHKNWENCIKEDKFMDKLYQLFKKGKKNWNIDDLFSMEAISTFLFLGIQKSMNTMEPEIKRLNDIHYAFIVPSEWEEEIREELIRRVFIEANLISEDDHKDRLLFYSDIESVFYGLEEYSGSKYRFKRGQNTILCRLEPKDIDTVELKLSLTQTTNTSFDFPGAMLFPKVLRSDSITITTNDFKGYIQSFLKDNLLFKPVVSNDNNDNKGHTENYIRDRTRDRTRDRIKSFFKRKLLHANNSGNQDSVSEGQQSENPNQIILRLTDKIYNSISYDRIRPFVDLESFNHSITSKLEPKSNEWLGSSTKYMNTSDICNVIGKNLLINVKNICGNKFGKDYILLVVDDKNISEVKLDHDLSRRLEYVLKYNGNYLDRTDRVKIFSKIVRFNENFKGVMLSVLEALKNGDMYCKPCIVSSERWDTSSYVWLYSRPSTIVNINISLESTLLSCSFINNYDRMTEYICEHGYFNADKSLPSLRSFYRILNFTALDVQEQFILFAERYLTGDLNFEKEDIITTIETILKETVSKKETLVTTVQKTYIKAFLLMYMIYIENIITSKLLVRFNSSMKIGYHVSIEKNLLDKIIGTKEKFWQLVYSSVLVKKLDDPNNLRVITQGEKLLPVIQRYYDIKFPLKSYSALAQIYDDYIQITLNQVVTDYSIYKKWQESIILQDEIVPIQNIYESLSLNMWNSIVQNDDLIELCDQHNESEIFELFSLKSEVEFMTHFKEYISSNILKNNSNSQNTEKNSIRLNRSCNCKVLFTINDVINICFKPILQEIATVVSSSLINEEMFGKYTNIKYLFNLIQFNHNPHIQKILARILKEEIDDFNPEQGIETSCMTIPKIFYQFLQLMYRQRDSLYKEFCIGTLYPVYTENYAFVIYETTKPNAEFLYKCKKTDTRWISTNSKIFIPFSQKGSIISNDGFSRKLFIKSKLNFVIEIYRYKTPKVPFERQQFFIKDYDCEKLHDITMKIKWEEHKFQNAGLSLLISVKPLWYSSSLQFSGKIVSQSIEKEHTCEIGQPMTLSRF